MLSEVETSLRKGSEDGNSSLRFGMTDYEKYRSCILKPVMLSKVETSLRKRSEDGDSSLRFGMTEFEKNRSCIVW